MDKRPANGLPTGAGQVVKRQRTSGDGGAQVGQHIPRTSNIQAPIMSLSGSHTGEVLCCKFDPSGNHIASGSFDRTIALWNTYGDCANYGILSGSKGAVTDLAWSATGEHIYSGSADCNLSTWDARTGTRLRKHIGHQEFVNSIDILKVGTGLIISGSDDATIGLWDPRAKKAVDYISDSFPITSVAFSTGGIEIFSAGIDPAIKAWDLRTKSELYRLGGHQDMVTSLAVSPDGTQLLSNSADNTVRTFDIKPFASKNRLLNVYEGSLHGIEQNLIRACWSSDGMKVAAGSSDRTVTVWDATSRKILYRLPGHKGTVNAVDFHPDENVIVSGSTDRTLLLGELGR